MVKIRSSTTVQLKNVIFNTGLVLQWPSTKKIPSPLDLCFWQCLSEYVITCLYRLSNTLKTGGGWLQRKLALLHSEAELKKSLLETRHILIVVAGSYILFSDNRFLE